MSKEWAKVREGARTVYAGNDFICEAATSELADAIIADHTTAALAVERAQIAEAALVEAKAALRDLAQKLKLPSSRALVRAALARIDQHPTQEAVDVNAIRRVISALVENCRGCREGRPRLTPEGCVDYKYHDLGAEPRKDVTDALGYDLEDYERLARYPVCDLSESQAAILADPAICPYLPTGQAGLEQAGETA